MSPNRRRFTVAVALLGGVWLASRACHKDPGARGLRVATYNIRLYGTDPTDEKRLREIIAGLDADVIAVQEIRDVARFQRLVSSIQARGQRYRFVPSRCGGKSDLFVGFVVDEARVGLRGLREYPELDPDGDERCNEHERAALLGRFTHQDKTFSLLVVHFAAGAKPDDARKRRIQWEKALRIADRLRADGDPALAILGDTNSIGFLDGRYREDEFIRGRVKAHGLRLFTNDLACSEYYPVGPDTLAPSMLDHIAASPEFPIPPTVRVHGLCAEHRCTAIPSNPPPHDFKYVSDHCPVTVGP